MDVNKLCPGCMEDDSGDPICPKCGRPADLTPKNSLQMKPRTMLRDQYMIGRALGHGGFGITYLAWDIGLEARLAIKEYMPNGVAGRASNDTRVLAYSDQTRVEFEYGLERFLEEARVLKKFRDHPNIVAIDTVFRENGTAYLVMEYLDGMTFEEFLKRRGGKITWETAVRVLLPVMDALTAVHAEGILHRDISPDNIYLTRTGKMKLIDFGAARNALGQKSRNLSIILKEGYAPEEQYRASGIQGPWTDVYATAATLYHALTGQVPQPSLDRQAEDQVRPPSEMGVIIDPAAEAALMTALAVRAADRFKSMEDFKAALNGGPMAQIQASTATTRKVDRNDPRIRELEQAAFLQGAAQFPPPPPPPGAPGTGQPGVRTGSGGPPPPPFGGPPPFGSPPFGPGPPGPPPMGAPMAAQMMQPAMSQSARQRWMWPAALGAVALLAVVVVMLRTPTPPDDKDKKDKTGVVDGGGPDKGADKGPDKGGGNGRTADGGGAAGEGNSDNGGGADKGSVDKGSSGPGSGGGGSSADKGGTANGGGNGGDGRGGSSGAGDGGSARNGGGPIARGGSSNNGGGSSNGGSSSNGGGSNNGGGANNGGGNNSGAGNGGGAGDGGASRDGGSARDGGTARDGGNSGGGGSFEGGRGRGGGEPPPGVESYDGLIQAAIKASQQSAYVQAGQLLNRAVALEPNSPKAYDKLGELDLYYLNQVGPALQNYQAAIAHGGAATFHVAHDHATGNFTTNCKGWLYVSKNNVRYQAFDSIHAFNVPRSEIREFKKNRFTVNLGNRAAVDLKAFHIKLADGKNYNFAPTSRFAEAERDLILNIGGMD